MNRSPRVLHFICSSLGGGAHQIAQLIGQPCFSDYQIAVIMPQDGDGRVVREITDAGARLITPKERQWFSPAHIAWLSGLIRRLEPDLFHLHGLRAAAPGRLAVLLAGKRPKVVYTIHGFHVLHYPPFRRRLGLMLERTLAPLTDRFICPSMSDSRALVDCRVAKAAKVTTILNGVDLKPTGGNVLEEFKLTGKRVITSVCRFHPPKDLDTLIDAFALVSSRHPHAVLMLVGDGPLRAALEDRVTAKGLQGKVIFTGMRPDVESFLRVTDLFCLSSRWEVTSLALIEAMAAEVPVIASDIDGLREVVSDGETGLLCPLQDTDRWADAMTRCLSDPVFSNRLAEAGHTKYREAFTAGRMAMETEVVYRELLGWANERRR